MLGGCDNQLHHENAMIKLLNFDYLFLDLDGTVYYSSFEFSQITIYWDISSRMRSRFVMQPNLPNCF